MDINDLIIPGAGPFLPVAALDACDVAADYAMAKERAARHLAAVRLTSPGDLDARHAMRSALAKAHFAHWHATGQLVNTLPDPVRREVLERARAIVNANHQENDQ